MNPRARTIAACERSVLAEMPWSQAREDQAVAAWRAVQSITVEAARQERVAIAEMIEHLTALRDDATGFDRTLVENG